MINYIAEKIEIILLYLYVFLVYAERLFIHLPVKPDNIVGALLFMVLLIKIKKRIYECNVLKRIILFICWCTASFFWLQNTDAAFVRYIMVCFVLLLTYFILNRGITRKELLMIECFMIISGLTCSMDLIINGKNFYGNLIESRLALSDDNDPNYFAMSLIVPFFAAYDFFYKERKIFKLIAIIGVGIIGYAIVLLASRGAMLAMVTGITLSMIFRRNYKLLLCFIIVIGTILSIVSQEFERYSMENIVERGGSGRLGIWTVGFEMAKDNFFKGVGIGNFISRYNEYAIMSKMGFSEGSHSAPHNGYIELLAELGMVGMGIYLNIFYNGLKKYLRLITNENLGLFCGLIAIMIAGGFLTIFAEKTSWLVFSVLIAYYRQKRLYMVNVRS